MRRKPAQHLFWAIPVAVVLSYPAGLAAGFFWCGVSGCSGGGFGVATGSAYLAVSACIVAAIIMAIPIAAIPWMKPHVMRIGVALVVGGLYGLLVAIVSHGPYPWRFE